MDTCSIEMVTAMVVSAACISHTEHAVSRHKGGVKGGLAPLRGSSKGAFGPLRYKGPRPLGALGGINNIYIYIFTPQCRALGPYPKAKGLSTLRAFRPYYAKGPAGPLCALLLAVDVPMTAL